MSDQWDRDTPQDWQLFARVTNGLIHREPRYRRYADHAVWSSIIGRLLAGASPWRTAYWVQDTVAEADPVFGSDTVTADALGKRFVRIQRLLPKTSVLPPSTAEALIDDAELEMDVVRELTALCYVHRQRIDAVHRQEQELGFPLEQQRREIKAYARTLMQLFAAQLALGIVPGRPPYAKDPAWRW